jgi:hypothetical protein
MKMDQQKFEQRFAIKFCVKLGESSTVESYKGLMENIPCLGHKSFFRRLRISGRRTSCGKTFNLRNRQQCGKSEVRSSNDVENDQQ